MIIMFTFCPNLLLEGVTLEACAPSRLRRWNLNLNHVGASSLRRFVGISHVGFSTNVRYPKMDGLSRFKIDDLGVPQFMETPIYSLMKLVVSHH